MKTYFSASGIFILLMIFPFVCFSQFTIYDTTNSNLVSNDCSRVAVDQNLRPWIGHAAHGLSVMDSAGSFTNHNSSDSPLWGQFVSHILRDGDRMWVNEYQHNFFLHQTDLWTSVPWIPDFSVYGLYKRGNNLWIATRYAGIFKLNVATGLVNTYDMSNGLPSDYMLRITGDTLGNIYAGTGFDGALKFNGNTWTNYTMYNSPLPSNSVFCVACDAFGNVWFGTMAGMAKLSNTGTWTVYDSITTGLPGNYIRTIVPWNNKLVVATAYGGLGIMNINTETWTNFTTSNSNLPVNTVFDVAISDSGDVWIPLGSSGIAVLPKYLPGVGSFGVTTGSIDNKLLVFPNPADSKINIQYYLPSQGTYTISLISLQGKTLLTANGSDPKGTIQKTLDIQGLPSGSYIVKLVSGNTVATKMVVIY
jgi:ligand-binding sensor domain-containing protein